MSLHGYCVKRGLELSGLECSASEGMANNRDPDQTVPLGEITMGP